MKFIATSSIGASNGEMRGEASTEQGSQVEAETVLCVPGSQLAQAHGQWQGGASKCSIQATSGLCIWQLNSHTCQKQQAGCCQPTSPAVQPNAIGHSSATSLLRQGIV